MKDLGCEVRQLFNKLSREGKCFLGGPPYTLGISRELSNYESYKFQGLPKRRRVCLGTCAFDSKGMVIGYQSSTVMNQAFPTNYEKINIGLSESLDYVQLKKIFVDPFHQGSIISEELLRTSLNLAINHSKNWVADVNFENKRMLSFLEKHGIYGLFNWKSPSGTLMCRLEVSSKNL